MRYPEKKITDIVVNFWKKKQSRNETNIKEGKLLNEKHLQDQYITNVK